MPFHNRKFVHRYYTEEGSLYSPARLSSLRGFVNLKEREAQEFNDLIDAFAPWDVRDWNCSDDGWTFSYRETKIRIKNRSNEESLAISASNRRLPPEVVNPMNKKPQHMLHAEIVKVNRALDFATLVLRFLETASARLLEWRESVRLSKLGIPGTSKVWQHGWDANFVNDWETILDNPFGLNLDSIADTAHHILGRTPKEICAGIPKDYRILHVESVLRQDLAHRFVDRQNQMRESLLKKPFEELRACSGGQKWKQNRKDELVEHLLRPRLTFHGTLRENVGSIVRYEFIKPEKKPEDTSSAEDGRVYVRCGSTFGRGIYSTPDADYSLCYIGDEATAVQSGEIPKVRMIVCATIMGRVARMTRDDNWRGHNKPFPNSDSHIGFNDLEYVVFDSSQDSNSWSRARARKRKKIHPKLDKRILYPGDKVRLQAAKPTAAAKWFPFGYGPATWISFVIQEIGEVSEDEENYGEFQEFVEEWDAYGYVDPDDADGGHRGPYWFDEYHSYRTMKNDP